MKKSKLTFGMFVIIFPTLVGALAVSTVADAWKAEVKVKERVETIKAQKKVEAIENRIEKKIESIDKEIAILAKYIKIRNSKTPIELAELQAKSILEVSKKHSVNYILINGMIEKESLYNPFSVSSASARGLMQVLKEDGVDIDQNKIHDVSYNIETGVKILQSKMKKADGNISKGLSLYSGKAQNYSNEVYENIGRYTMFREKELGNSIVTVAMREK